jgi:hypothetical protein
MSVKSLLMTGALALASVPLVYGASFEVVFATPVQVDNSILAPGAYRVQAKHGGAEFTNVNTGTIYNLPATVEHLTTKNHSENVVMSYRNGMARLHSVQVGGHATNLQFLG